MFQSRQFTSSLTKEVALTLAATLFLAVISQISIPLKPVPITLQTAGVLLIGLTYAPRAALLSTLTYLAIGAVGLPVFSGMSSGLSILTGTTAGYLAAFPVVAYGIAWARERWSISSKWGLLGLCVLGQGVFFTFGVAWLSHLIGFIPAVMAGFLPFILPGIGKAILTASIASYLLRK